jgi:hypothetical protein
MNHLQPLQGHAGVRRLHERVPVIEELIFLAANLCACEGKEGSPR